MKIHFQSSGGIEGTAKDITIDTRAGTDEQSSELTRLVNESNFFELPNSVQTGRSGADLFNYEITIEEGERSHSVKRNDLIIEPQLDTLIDYLRRAALRNAMK